MTAATSVSEESRALLQERLRFWALLTGSLAALFWFVAGALLATRAPPIWYFAAPTGLFHGAVVAEMGIIALVLWRWAASSRVLDAMDAAATIGGGIAFAGMEYFMPPPVNEFTGLLAISYLLIGRATLLPSRPARAAVLGALTAAPNLLVAILIERREGGSGLSDNTVEFATWCLVGVIATTVIARVIYGLRRQVREAMRLGQYTLTEKIGEGGMGVVFKASHAMLRRPTAIKLLPSERAGEAALARFEREVQLTSQLTHPNTISIYDYGRTPDGVFYYAMEFLEGMTLEDLVQRFGPQPEARVVHFVRQIAGALAEAHAAGLIHRDVKPANVILTERGGVLDVVKVLDFGLVKHVAMTQEPASDGGAGDMGATALGTITGTPLYIAPEAIQTPDKIDARVDVYALGAVAYFLLAGKHAFAGRTVAEVIGHHLHTRPPRPSAARGAPIDAALEKLVLDCLAKDPDARPPSAVELIARLDACAVSPWTQDDARGWWDERRARVAEDMRPSTAGIATTVAVDIAQR
jgi:serine/threonine-protein kinase